MQVMEGMYDHENLSGTAVIFGSRLALALFREKGPAIRIANMVASLLRSFWCRYALYATISVTCMCIQCWWPI